MGECVKKSKILYMKIKKVYFLYTITKKSNVLGHEMVGRIVEIGEGVTTDYAGQSISVGDRVVPVYYLTCQKCNAGNTFN
jgi:D-arabinose 1-dehydrogenase-like Zn-dependent alcohol dehydrogenase